MQTRVLPINPRLPEGETIETAARALADGRLVAFPTETVYGLGADALDEGAVNSIYAAKGRPGDNPLIVHIASLADLPSVADPSPEQRARVERLARKFWPGPLTLVLPKKSVVPDAITAGLATVAVRMPDHPVALALIRAVGRPLAAPSANRSGRPSPTDAAHVLRDLGGRIPFILDGGPTTVGLESTVVDLTVAPAVIHRPGTITAEMLSGVLAEAVLPALAGDEPTALAVPATGTTPVSPGVKYGHYAPSTHCVLIEGPFTPVARLLYDRIKAEHAAGKRVGVLATREGAAVYGQEADALCIAGSRAEPDEIARNLYRCLRHLDEADIDIIYIEGVAEIGVGAAIMNRMSRAASHRIVRAPDE